MKTKYDLTNARLVVDDYVSQLENPNRVGWQGRTEMEFILQKHGIIADVRALAFGESHALWYACLLVTKSVRRVSRMEVARHKVARGARTTETTIRQCLSSKPSRMRDNLVAGLLRGILENIPASDLTNNP